MADEQFNPSEHTVEQIEEYVAANPDDLDRVKSAEEADKNRSSIRWPTPVESAPKGDSDSQGDGGVPGPDGYPGPDALVPTNPVESSGVDEGSAPGGDDDKDGGERPVWNVETHGQPTDKQREYYRVVGE